jgi:hypothetical protein
MNFVEKWAVGGGRDPDCSLGQASSDRTGQTEDRAVVGGCDASKHPVSSAVIRDADVSSAVGTSGCWLGVKNGIQYHRLKMRDESPKAFAILIPENGSLTVHLQRP